MAVYKEKMDAYNKEQEFNKLCRSLSAFFAYREYYLENEKKRLPRDRIIDSHLAVVTSLFQRWRRSINAAERARFVSDAWNNLLRYEKHAEGHYIKLPESSDLFREREKYEEPQPEPVNATTGFLLFLEELFDTYEKDPDKKPDDVIKERREKWNTLTDSEKAPYLKKANECMDKFEKHAIDMFKEGSEELGSEGGEEELGEAFLENFEGALDDAVGNQKREDWNNLRNKRRYVDGAAKIMRTFEDNAIVYYKETMELVNFSEEKVSPATGFLVFLESFLQKDPTIKGLAIEEKHEEWNSLTDDEKHPYISEAEAPMSEYDNEMIHSCKILEYPQQDEEELPAPAK